MGLDWHPLREGKRQGFCSGILAPVDEDYWF